MPTLPLYTPPEVPDASHRVVGPGGYEWWHFDAVSAEGDVTVVARLGAGFLPHPQYTRRYERYRRRPTRHPPPLPDEYPCVEWFVCRGPDVLVDFSTHVAPDQYLASHDLPRVRAGSNEFVREADGTLHLRLRGGPAGGANSAGSAELTFRPRWGHGAAELSIGQSGAGVTRHGWVVAAPLCEVTGTVVAPDGRRLEFRGLGYHDHGYGVEPRGIRNSMSLRGRVVLEDRVLAFQVQDNRRRATSDALLVEADASGVRRLQTSDAGAKWHFGSGEIQEVPDAVNIGVEGHGELRLSQPRVLGQRDDEFRVNFSASIGSASGNALCEVRHYVRQPG